MASFINSYEENPHLMAPAKIHNDGFITLFLYNIVCILVAWMVSVITFFACVCGVKILEKFEDFSDFQKYQGFALWLYTIKYKGIRILKTILKPMNDTFITTGMLRVFISTTYDFNFAIFLELGNPHL
jgi:hypothetical protein